VISPQPSGALYQQVADRLRSSILSGKLRPGQPLPSERTLQQEFGIARGTVRRAISLLRNEGLVVIARGHGVLVKEQPELDDLILPAGAVVTARMPTPEERLTHEISDGVPVFWVIRPDGSSVIYPADRYRIRQPQ
jgi:DNA-binding FadR family transcriptional regulator